MLFKTPISLSSFKLPWFFNISVLDTYK
jgi:hypothetical protein